MGATLGHYGLLLGGSGSGGGAYTGWTPANASVAPYFWYISDDAGNTGVTTIVDKSGNGRNASALSGGGSLTSTGAGIGGRRAVRYIGGVTGDGHQVGSSTGILNNKSGATFASVYDIDSQGSAVADYLLFIENNTTNTTRFAYTPTNGTTINAPGFRTRRLDADTSVTLFSTTAHPSACVALAVMDYANNDSWLRVDGTQDNASTSHGTAGNTSATNSANNVWIGRVQSSSAPEGLHGMWGEMVFWDVALSSTEQQKLEGYLAWKWGLTANLPGGHPYKSVQPPP